MPSAVVQDQPESLPRPLFGLGRRSESLNFSRMSKSPKKKNRAGGGTDDTEKGGRFTFANRLRNQSDASSRRPLISAPTDFRHLGSGSGSLAQSSPIRSNTVSVPRPSRPGDIRLVDGPVQEHRPLLSTSQSQSSGLRPLELSIHMPHNRLSSLLPSFEIPPSPTPPPAYASDDSASAPPPAQPSQASALRSYPSFSFHVPRKHLRESPPPSLSDDADGQSAAPKAKKGRSRADTAPSVQVMKDRVANAMLEMEWLQKQIDDVVERHSMYTYSRPSSSHSMARTLPDLEPMPSIPALPPSAPSFAERVQGEVERPRTAPAPLVVNPTFTKRESSLPAGRREATVVHLTSPPPPLPLVLRPPLRKKKSFSKVSKWLFSEPTHKRDQSLDSVTNMPRPTKGKDGFYQSIAVSSTARESFDSLHSHSTTDAESESGIPSVFNAYSPARPHELERCGTFGQGRQHVRMSVGVAI